MELYKIIFTITYMEVLSRGCHLVERNSHQFWTKGKKKLMSFVTIVNQYNVDRNSRLEFSLQKFNKPCTAYMKSHLYLRELIQQV